MSEYPLSLGAANLALLERADEHHQVRTLEGCFFRDMQDQVIGPMLNGDRTWEARETAWVKSVVDDGDFVIDIGANLGWYSVIAAARVGPSGRVLAVEPEPRNFNLLKKNIQWNGMSDRCRLFELALLDYEGTCKLELCPINFGDHRVRLDADPSSCRENAYQEHLRSEIAVSVTTLDALIAACVLQDRRIRLLKIDAQGSEVAILRGAPRTLQNTQYLLCEYWPYGMQRLAFVSDDFVRCLRPHFAEFARVRNGSLHFQPIAQLANALLIPPDTLCGEAMYVFRKHGRDR